VLLETDPWSDELKTTRFLRGPHKSANEYIEFLQEEFLDFCQKGFWMLLPYSEVEDMVQLRLSPLGCVPQRDRRPRVIVDYSFYGLNGETIKLAPRDSMQFGKANERLMTKLLHANPRFGSCHMYKIDIGDGFYRIPLSTSGVPKLGVCLPPFPGLPPLVAFPLVLPMGWTESPPFFCCFTETACDLANSTLRQNLRSPIHPLEALAGAADRLPNPERGEDNHPLRPTPLSHQRRLATKPLSFVDVFVDDFCAVGQDHHMNPLSNQRRTLMHTIDKVFRPNDALDVASRKEPISTSKLAKQDGAWQDVKRALGWDYAVRSKHLLVAAHRKDKVSSSIDEALSQRRLGLTKWQSLIGQLRSLVPGMPGGEGQFSLLQAALCAEHQGRVKIAPSLRSQLQTFRDILGDTERVTQLDELIPGDPIHIGACDAAKAGMGGVWFPHAGPPLLWRQPFPKPVRDQIVSFSNPHGKLTNSDLELAGTVVHQAILGDCVPVCGETAHTLCDNTPAVAWRTKGSTTTTKPAADLLRLASFIRREQRCHHRISHISGDDNRMSDDASRRWDLDDTSLLTHFNRLYPQRQSWQLCHPNPLLSSAVTSMLCHTTSLTASAPPEWYQLIAPGKSGAPFVSPSRSTQALANSKTLSPCSTLLHDAGRTVDWHPKGSRSALVQRRTPYAQWARRFPNWGPRTLA
jgi:hypothetical protein